MPWKLSRWKACDWGCSARSPTFPDMNNLGTVPGRHPHFMAGDRFVLGDAVGGVNPDGGIWRDGNKLHKDIWDLYERVDRDISKITVGSLRSLPTFRELFTLNWPPEGSWKGQAIQWFFDRCFGWPVRGTHVQAILDRMAELGLWDPTIYDPGIFYDVVYSDEERVFLGQEFHVTSEMTLAEKEVEEPACCHYWEEVDG